MLRTMFISKPGKYVHMVGTCFSIFKTFPRCARLGAILRYSKRNFSGAILMKRLILREYHHVRPDISNEMSGGRYFLKERLKHYTFPKSTFCQVHHPHCFVFRDRRINVILSKFCVCFFGQGRDLQALCHDVFVYNSTYAM